MKLINKQKFLAELGKLLTFMYEEDRQKALQMYGRMFDNAVDEHALLQLLVSPTRQAVVVARAYDSKERRLRTVAASREETELSFDENGLDAVPAYLAAIEKINLEAIETGAVRGAGISDDQISLFPDGEEPEGEPAAEENAAEAEPAADDAGWVTANVDSVFSETAEEETEEYTDEYTEPEKKPVAGLLIPYILFAVILGLAGTVVLLTAAVLFLLFASAMVILGILIVSSVLSGFAMLADVLVVAGAALIVFALGLLFLWTFVWFLGGAIPGLIRGLAELGRKWCYKEVEEE